MSGTEAATFAYNLDRQLVRLDRSDGQSVQLDFNTAGRLETVTHPGGVTTVTYDAANGRPQTVTAPGSTLGFSYDGPLVTGTTWSGEVHGSLAWSYDDRLRVISERVDGGQPIAWQYDRDDLPTQVGDLAIARDAETGFITDTALRSVTTHRSYNAFGELAQTEARVAGTVTYQLGLEHDKSGRIVAKTESVAGDTHRFDYTYDLDGRLVQVERDGQPWSMYTYDSNGNRLTYRGVLGDADGIYDDQDRLLEYGDKRYDHTAAGKLGIETQGEQLVQLGYDVFGSLKIALLAGEIDIEYVVDGLGRRIGKKINGTLVQCFLYANELKPVAELDGAGNVVSRFVYGTNPIVPDYLLRNGSIYQLVTDQVGSARLVIDTATGEVVQRLDYDEFGRVLLDTSPGFQPFGFAGGLYDYQTKLVRFGARDYDPDVGRWTAKDPIGFRSHETNLYAYALGSPQSFTDQSGRIPLPLVTGAIGGIAGILGSAAGQLLANGGVNCFSWTDLWIAGGVGFTAGLLAPFVATSYVGAALLGAGANTVQTGLTNLAHDKPISSGLGRSAAIGALAGVVGGAIARPTNTPFNPESFWLDGQTAASVNNWDAILPNVAGKNLLRSAGAGFLSNANSDDCERCR